MSVFESMFSSGRADLVDGVSELGGDLGGFELVADEPLVAGEFETDGVGGLFEPDVVWALAQFILDDSLAGGESLEEFGFFKSKHTVGEWYWRAEGAARVVGGPPD